MRPSGRAVPIFALLLGLCADASAQAREPEPATWSLELKTGPYKPRIGGGTERAYYKLYFGTKQPLLWGANLERYFDSRFGLFGVFGTVGYWNVSGRARMCASGTVQCDPSTVFSSQPGTDRTSLTAVPLSGGLVYRMDLLQRRWAVPFVVYGKAGFDYFIWTISGSNKTSARGATAGYHGTLGLAMSLDWLEPSAGREGRAFVDSYVFAEISKLMIDGFGERRRLDLSGQPVQFGLVFTFR